MENANTQTHRSANRLAAILLTLFLLLTCMNGISIDASAASSGFYVSGTTICDANGNPFEMRGVNIPHAWYTSYTETSIKGASALGANTVRIVLGNGQKYSKTSASEVSKIIEWCKKYKVICILEVHDATGSDSVADLNAAVNYWKELKSLLNANTEYVIVNIANEWFGSWDGKAWADGYKSAIKSLRNAGINNMLMIDSAGWGQYPDSIKNYGKEVFNADSQRNTVFSIHMYEYAGGNASTVKTNINNALSTGVPVVIGEFGGQHTDGDVDEYTIMSYCEQKGVGYLGWSWKGNSGGLDYLDIANSWDGSSLTSWGNTLFNDTNGIKKTSTVCSVYGGSSSGSSSNNSSTGIYTDANGGVIGLDGTYYFKSVHSGKYLDISGGKSSNGANVIQYQFNGGNNQKFKLVGDGNGYYSILTACSGYKSGIDVSGKSSANGTNIIQWQNNGGDNQKFQIVKIGNAYAVKTKISNCYSCLDVYNWSTENGANIAQYEYWGGACQLWYLEAC